MTAFSVLIRPAERTDLAEVMRLINDKAAFDGCPAAVSATVNRLNETLFCARPKAYILLAEVPEKGLVGFVSYHFTYSTFLACSGLWMDDIFVDEVFRNRQIGARFVQALCAIAQSENCKRIDWTVNRLNAAGIRFYERMGANVTEQLRLCRLDATAIEQGAALLH